ncbi:MAG: SUMF1/EgtB/PvdO family nonheme iron enzyme [Myxococcota bacterium]
MHHLRRSSTLALALIGTACISTVTPPEPIKQAKIAYGPKVYLRDSTFGEPTAGRPCVLLGKLDQVKTGSVVTSTTVGGEPLTHGEIAFNCYVEVTPGELFVDEIETTNRLFQLCVDSSVCKNPNPADVDRVPVCQSDTDFDSCPVVAVEQFEANRMCNFVGKRLPTGVESLIMRMPNNPQKPEDVLAFAYGATPDPPASNCEQAVLKGCNKPYPIQGSEAEPKGAARLDKTPGNATVFDLTGNATEWSADLLPASGRAGTMPWFCEVPLATTTATATCPSGDVCIRGNVLIGGVLRDVPVCLASHQLSINNGTAASTFGGGFNTEATRLAAGTFARVARTTANKDADVGFRCVNEPGKETTVQPVLAP